MLVMVIVVMMIMVVVVLMDGDYDEVDIVVIDDNYGGVVTIGGVGDGDSYC